MMLQEPAYFRIQAADRVTWLSLRDVAQEVGVHPLTVTRAIKAGRLKATRIGRLYRIRRDWMQAWLCPDLFPLTETP